MCPCSTLYEYSEYTHTIYYIVYIFLGHSWQRFRLESAAAATAKAHDTSTATGRHAHTGGLALLRRGRTFNIDRHLESTRSAFTKSAHLVSTQHKLTTYL